MLYYILCSVKKEGGIELENYYNDKYNLDVYSSGKTETERKTRSASRSRPRSAAPRSASPTRTRRERSVSASRSPRPPKVQPTKATKSEKPAKQAKTAKQTSQAPKKQKNVYKAQRVKSKSRRAMVIASSVVVAAVIATAACIIGYNIYRENKKNAPFKFSEGVKISGIDISNLSMEEAEKKLTKNAIKAVPDFTLDVTANETSKTYKKTDFTYTYSFKSQLEEAKLYSLKEQGIYDPPKGETQPASTGELTLPKLEIGYKLNAESVKDVVSALAKEVDKTPKDAKVKKFNPFSNNRFEYKEGTDGYHLYQSELRHSMAKFIKSGESSGKIDAEVETLTPDITVSDLQEKIIGLSTVTSYSNNTEDGNTNMRVALKACNGSVIEPGAIWSFNDCTGDSNDPANGYKKATVINDRKLEEGYGGGICQASTTIFQAAAFANMGIIERHNHYWASGYAFAGEDATIDYPNLDLQLRNNTDYQMFIESKMDGSTLTVNIYGVQEDYYDNVKLYTKNTDIVKGKSFDTSTYRVLYLDGKIVSEDEICHSEYSLTDKHVVRDEDEGSFRTMVDGTIKYETATSEPKTEETSATFETTETPETSETSDTQATEEPLPQNEEITEETLGEDQ